MIKQVLLSAFLLSMCVAVGQAQDIASITQEIESLQTNSALDEDARNTAIAILTEAKQTVVKANERAAAVRGFVTTAASASTTIEQLRDELTALGRQDAASPTVKMTDAETSVALADLIAERTALIESLSDFRSRQTALSTRGEAIATEIAEARRAVLELQDTPPTDESASGPIVAASQTLYAVRLAERQAAIADLTRDRASLGARQDVIEARITLASARIEQLSRSIEQVQNRLGNSQTAKAAKWVAVATRQLAEIPANLPQLSAYAKENFDLAEANLALVKSNILIATETSRLQQDLARISASAQLVDQVLATGQLSNETAELLRNVQTKLPNAKGLTQATLVADQAAVALRLNLILWQDQLRNLGDAQEYTIERLREPGSDAQSFDSVGTAKTLINQRREYLQALTTAARDKSDEIVAQRSARQDMMQQSVALSRLLDRRLLWLPTKSGFGAAFWKNIRSNISWLGSGSGWQDTGHALVSSFRSEIGGPTVLALFAVGLALLAKLIRARLLILAQRVGDVRKDTYFTTPAALILSFLHTLPWPLAIGALGLAIEKGSTTSFTAAVAQGLYATAGVAIILGFFRTLARPNGVFLRHFAWNEDARLRFRRHLNWFIAVQALVAFVFTAAIASSDSVIKYGIGRLAFIVSSIAIAVFSYYILNPRNGIALSIRDDNKFTGTTWLLLVLLVAAPLTIGLLLPVAGYYDAAIELQSRVFQSGIVILLAAVLYRLSMRLFLVGHRRLALRCAEEKRARQKAKRDDVIEADQSGDAVPEIVDNKELDLDTLSSQSGRAVFVISYAVLILGLWATWSALLPALGIANDVILWNGVRSIDGIAVSTGISLWDLAVASIFVIGGFIVARNVGGILELVVFERLPVDSGTRYAVITIGKYTLISFGVIIGLSRLGLDWSSMQWVIAALGVGLGFGLQEIVANFVSGLIILFERPIRVGDIVTIGQLEGTVTSIKIRATRITDFDNREVLMPNKSIITENVTNWTLNDQVTRIIIRVGVAYGSDIDQVRDIIMEAVSRHTDTLLTPSPAVFFMAHGDSSLDFEARVFVATPNKRLPVTHDLNRSINIALAKNGIEIPFPQRDLHIRTGGEASEA